MVAERWDRERAPDEGRDQSHELPNDVEAEARLLGAIVYGGHDFALDVLEASRAILPSGACFDDEAHGAAYDAALALADRWEAACAAAADGGDDTVEADSISDDTIRAELKVRARAGDAFAAAALDLLLLIYSNRFSNAFFERRRLEPDLTMLATVEEDAGRIVETWARRQQMFDTATLMAFYQQGDNAGAQVVLERMQERSYAYLGQRRPATLERDELRQISDQLAEWRRIRRLPAEVMSAPQKLAYMALKERMAPDAAPIVLTDAWIGGECGISEDTAGKAVARLDELGCIAKTTHKDHEYVTDATGKTVIRWTTTRSLCIGERWETRETIAPQRPRKHGGLQTPTVCAHCGSTHVRDLHKRVCDECHHEEALLPTFPNPADLDEAMVRTRMNSSDPQLAPVWRRESTPIVPQLADRWENSALTDSDPPSNLRTLFGDRFTAGAS